MPGDVEAFYYASIHGQASGYVREWRTDIGAKVHKGEILAVIETPELVIASQPPRAHSSTQRSIIGVATTTRAVRDAVVFALYRVKPYKAQ